MWLSLSCGCLHALTQWLHLTNWLLNIAKMAAKFKLKLWCITHNVCFSVNHSTSTGTKIKKKETILYNFTFNTKELRKMANMLQWHFEMHVLEWKLWNFDSNLQSSLFFTSNLQWVSTASGIDLVPKRWQNITWTKDFLLPWCMHHLASRS